jgi:hypothetical protein
MGDPEAAIEECVGNCDAVSSRACIAWAVTFANVDIAAFLIAVHSSLFLQQIAD